MVRNARVLLEALRLGNVKILHREEIEELRKLDPDFHGVQRAWNYWASRAGCADLLSD